ncbi:hypothetical protein BJX99DRAFT_247768 [Aspergillus californicus]
MQHLPVILAMGCAQLVIRAHGLLSGSLILAMFLSLVIPLWLALVCCSSRALRTPNPSKTFLGQPRLLPTQVSHTRLGTGRYNYTVPHFMVGTPVGLHGHVGSLLSLDEPKGQGQGQSQSQSQNDSRTQTTGLMQYLRPKTEAWFTVHAHHHLEKGSDSIGLQGKLHNFLVSQGLHPGEWPYAYLATMPQFLGYQRNLVCVWYLYSASRELTAMVMEVNNYWGQRKIAFSRLTGEVPLHQSSTTGSLPSPSTCQFHHSNPRHKTYSGTWDKDMFISPFEKVEGTISLRFSDPLAPNTPLHITITLLSPSGKPRLIGRVFCPEGHGPIDPLTASAWSLLRFLPYWTGVLVITELFIIVAALVIRSKGATLFSMPEVRPGNLPRDETDVERNLEPAFRAYLRHLVDHSPSPLEITYIPPKSHHFKHETFISPDRDRDLSPNSAPSLRRILTLQVLAPSFYTSFPSYKDPVTAFTEESRPIVLDSDPSSCRLLISDMDLVLSLLSSHYSQHYHIPISTPTTSNLKRPIFFNSFRLSDDIDPLFMDTFVQTHLPPSNQRVYNRALLKHHLSTKLAFGSHSLLALYVNVGYILLHACLSYICFWLVAGAHVPIQNAVNGGLGVWCHVVLWKGGGAVWAWIGDFFV